MYNKGDNTYKSQPKIMSKETLNHTAIKIAKHVAHSKSELIHITFHGGEPMLVNKDFFISAVKLFNETIQTTVVYSIQTNGTLLDNDWFELFDKLQINVGISIDGPKEYHDFYRKFHNDTGSFDLIIKNLEDGKLLYKYGILFVVNPSIPVAVLYDFIKINKINTLNILLPDHHYNDLPNYTSLSDGSTINIGNWLVELYDLWKNDFDRPNISFFENIIKSFFNLSDGTQILGSCFNNVICIETDGAIEVIDSLRTCENGITKNNLNVKFNDIDDIFENEIFKLYYNSHSQVSEKCKNCEVLEFCGGGFLPHRYSKINKFDNPSIYCDDLFNLIKYIENDVQAEIEKI
jgi:uncharacterized protein